jgi:serine/threonine protein kinase/Tol biopolymer transport system component
MRQMTVETLQARMERRPLRLAEALDLTAQIATALASAHARGVVHGHLQPDQVRILPEGRVEVVGYGLAPPGGAPAYRSPEQLRGDPGDARSDVWALGAILHAMLTGRVPRPPLPETPLGPPPEEGPPAITRIVERALARDPAARYDRIEAMLQDLRAVEASLPEGAEPIPAGMRGLPLALSGRKVSHFQVADLLGGGGMGVIYRAEDIRLGRTVALKFLAPELGRDPIAKARFLTEARAASTLEHPNLCTILDVGETEEGLLFLAMPLYDGESLDRRLARGALSVAEALDVATQVARGLAKAHQQGIVHRDVKPANLFLTGDGVVKVLDFGIAKLAGEAGPTREGAFLGTPVYMAPEQMRGEEVDARADVWSLGVVLYKMLAGRPPFRGGSDEAVLHAVLHEEPEPLSHLRPEVPAEIERIVSRMLARNLEERYADAGEVLNDLRRAQGLASTTIPNATAGKRGGRLVWIALGAALLAIVVFVGSRVWRQAPDPQPGRAVRLTDFQGKETFPSLSPDGTFFVYARLVGNLFHIFLQRVSGGNPIDLTPGSPVDNSQPAYSPDGQQIAFRSERDGGGIFLMGATGESVRRLTDFGFNPAWAPDGKELAVGTEKAYEPSVRVSTSQIFRVGLTGETRRSLGVPDGVQPSWSPHGWRIAYWGVTREALQRGIWTVVADGGAPVPVVEDSFLNWSPAWSPDGKFLYFASDRGGSMNLWRVAIDERSGKVLGSPQPITTPSEWSALLSFSRDGRILLYATKDNRSFVEQVAFDPERSQTAGSTLVLEGVRSVASCEISPDERRIALWFASPQEDLFLVRPDGKENQQLTNDPARDRKPHWSPDGRRILFYSNRSGKYEAWTIRPDGSGLTAVTHLPAHNVYNPVWSPDGTHIGFTYGPQGTAILDLLHPTSEPRVLPRVEGGQVLARATWSRDGRFLAGQLLRPDESPVPGIILWRLADNTYRRLTNSGNDPEFFRDGKRILFTEPEAIRLVTVATGEVKTLLPAPPHFWFVRGSVGPGDRTLCTVRTTDEGDIWLLSLAGSGDRP